jgi:hypothetical protein
MDPELLLQQAVMKLSSKEKSFGGCYRNKKCREKRRKINYERERR